ncbi:FHA domain-containing protein [uncultured Gimesia sp.]|uniref:FHA domain-containing protein n=1 Tax=uncultured Gimesia sp. TaxID=1678688 RepID=UPI00261DF9E1|nr:FHA domain-containing protein [uncultured Gimesia sp.]
MFTTSSPHSQVTQNSSEPQLQVSLVPLTDEMSPVELTTGEYQIGSSPECAIRIDVPGIAAEHCIIHVGQNTVSVRAIDPRVWVNERPIRKISLIEGMKFFVGPIGILVDTINKIEVEEINEQPPPEDGRLSRNQIEIPEELEAMAKYQRILEERQLLLEKVESEQIELQREIQLQEAELGRLHEQFALNQESNQVQVVPTTQLAFDDAILELDQKLQQLDLLKQEVLQELDQVLSQQNELRGDHQSLVQWQESLKSEQVALTQQQQNLSQGWLDLEAQQACEQVAFETETAFLEKSKTEQEERQKAVLLAEQSYLSYEQELIEERQRLEIWSDDLETQEKSVSDQRAGLSEQKRSDVDQEKVQLDLNQQTEQLQQERNQLEEARRKLADEQTQLKQQEQSILEVREEFEQKNAALQERESQFSQQQSTLEQREADLNSQEADLKTQLQNLEKQQTEYALQMSQLEEQQTRFETEKLEWENARMALKQDQIEFEARTSEIENRKNSRKLNWCNNVRSLKQTAKHSPVNRRIWSRNEQNLI